MRQRQRSTKTTGARKQTTRERGDEKHACSVAPQKDFEARLLDRDQECYGAKSGKIPDKRLACHARKLEIENAKRLGVFEPTSF